MIRRLMAEVSADTPEARVRELLAEVVDALDLDAEIEVFDDGEVVTGTLVGEDLGLVIGRHGQTIAAALQAQADQAVADALRFARPVALDAMTASDRKVVHEYLRDRGDVETYSEGDEPDRHLVVAPLRP